MIRKSDAFKKPPPEAKTQEIHQPIFVVTVKRLFLVDAKVVLFVVCGAAFVYILELNFDVIKKPILFLGKISSIHQRQDRRGLAKCCIRTRRLCHQFTSIIGQT